MILEQIRLVISVDGACIWIVEAKDQAVLHITNQIGDREVCVETKVNIQDTPLTQAATQQKPILITSDQHQCEFCGSTC